MRVALPIESIERAANQLLRIAPDVEIVEPPTLKQTLIARLRDLGWCYGVTVGKKS